MGLQILCIPLAFVFEDAPKCGVCVTRASSVAFGCGGPGIP